MKAMVHRLPVCLPYLVCAGSLLLSGCSKLPPDVAANEKNAVAIRESIDAGGTATATAAAEVAQPTGWATLKGKFKINGAAPARTQLTIDKEQSVCAPGGKQVFSEELVVDSSGGVKDVVLFVSQTISDDEPWTHPTAKSGKSDNVIIDQKECLFLTHMLAMQTTQNLFFMNSDSVAHNASMTPGKNGGFNALDPPGVQLPYQDQSKRTPLKQEEEPFSVGCSIHPWMKAFIIFRKNSYFAVSKPDGSFEIPNLPAGVDLEFRAWQEKTKFVQSVTVNGKPQKWAKGKFKLKLTPNEPTELDVVIDLK